MKYQRYTDDFKKTALEKFYAQEHGIVNFCKQEQLPISTFCKWVAKSKKAKNANAPDKEKQKSFTTHLEQEIKTLKQERDALKTLLQIYMP